jgi:hypothetical protein
MFRWPKAALLLGFLTVFLGFGAWLYFRIRLATLTDKPEISLSDLKTVPEPEPGQIPAISFSQPNMSCAERLAFLSENYTILRRVTELPRGIQKLYTIKGESRVAMADPGERFQATDVVEDSTLPWRRLIFAGVAQDRAFVHYEHGGIGRFLVVEFFDLKSPEVAIGVWHGFYGPAKSLANLRRVMSDTDCK